MHLSNMTPQKYADNLVTKICKVADVYDEKTLNEVFVEEFVTTIPHTLRY